MSTNLGLCKTRCLSLALLAGLVMGIQTGEAGVLGTYEFTDNSLAITDADIGDGITFSDFNLNNYTVDEAFSAAGDLVADPALDEISLNGVESPNGTGTALSDGDFLSFEVTNNSGQTLAFQKLTGDFNKTKVYQNFQARVFTTASPGSVTDDTIAKLGAASGGTEFEEDEAVLNGNSSEAGANTIGVPLTLASGSSVTFYLPYNMSSNSDTRHMGIDNIEIIGVVIPEPATCLLGMIGICCFVSSRNRR